MGDAAINTVQIGKGWFPEESGGLDRYYYELVTQLPALSVAVNGLVTGTSRVAGDTAGAVRAFAPATATLPARCFAVRRLAREVLARHPDSIFVGHFALYTAPCLDLLGDRPLVMHFQGPWAAESRAEGAGRWQVRVKHRVEQMVYSRAQRFIVLSHAFGRILEEQYDIPADRIQVIPGGVDVLRWSPRMSREDARRAMGWPSDRPIVLLVRRLVHRMGLEELIDSVAAIRRRVADPLILVAGSGPLRSELERRALHAGADRYLKFLGFVPDDQLATAYRAADLSLVPSVSLEGFGLVAAESLASGTPVLATAVGGLPETVAGLSPDCLIAEPGADALAAAVSEALLGQRLLPDEDECIRYAHRHFSWGNVIQQVRDTYRQVLQ